jgi:hypothetical protein
MFRRFQRVTLALGAAAILAGGTVVAGASPVAAYGAANWQITFAGTATFPNGGGGFGFWGWCDLAGGTNSGNNGDCQFAQYLHAPSGGFTCQESLNITSWDTSAGFVITGTAAVHPTSLTAPCLSFFPGSSPFSGVGLGVPAAAGHYNLGNLIPGVPGELQITVTQIR